MEGFRRAVHHSQTGVCVRTITSPGPHRVAGTIGLFCPVGIVVDIVRGTCGGGTWSHSPQCRSCSSYHVSLKSSTFGVSELRHESIPPYKRIVEPGAWDRHRRRYSLRVGMVALVLTPRCFKVGFKPERFQKKTQTASVSRCIITQQSAYRSMCV